MTSRLSMELLSSLRYSSKYIKQHSLFYLCALHRTLQVPSSFQTESMKTIVIQALADTLLEGDEHFTISLFPAESGAVIDPLNGQNL